MFHVVCRVFVVPVHSCACDWLLIVVCCVVYGGYSLSVAVCCSLFADWRLLCVCVYALCVVRCVLCVVRCVLCAACCVVCVVFRCGSFVVCC